MTGRTLGQHLCVLTAAAAFSMAPAAAQTTIDDFSDAGANTIIPPGLTRTTVGSTSGTDSGLSGVIGGTRTLTVDMTAAGGATPNVTAGVSPSFQILSYASSVFGDGAVTLFYDGNGSGLAADLSLGTGIEVQIASDASAVPYTVTLTLSDGLIMETDVQAGLMSGLALVQFDYADFPTVDLTAIDSIEVAIDTSLAGDFETAGPGIVTFGEPVCGNGVVEPLIGEVCDDGNAFGGDGCENDCTLSAACTFSHGGSPTERFVGVCGAPTFADIQSAVTASSPGDIVTVCPGTYFENVVVDEEVTIRSASGAATTTINAAGPGIIFDVQRSGVTIEDLTLVAGSAAAVISADEICSLGEGPCIDPGFGSNLTIRDNVIRDGTNGINWTAAMVNCLTVDGNTVTDVTSHPVRIHNTIGDPSILVSILGNTVTGAVTNPAVNLSGHGELFVVGQNTIEDNVDGLRLASITASSTTPTVVENGIGNNTGNGIIVDAGAAGVRIVQNNIEGNGTGLLNNAPEAVLDATLNWWGSQTGPLHVTERPAGMGDEVIDTSGLDTTFVEFLCAPAPGGFPSIGGECNDAEPEEEITFIAIGNSPDVSPSGRYISFVSAEDISGDDRITIDNTDGSSEAFLFNRRPLRQTGAICLGGTNPGGPCTRQRDCPEDLNADPIVTEGACILISQISNDPSGAGMTFDPRVNRRGDVSFATDVDLTGTNGDGSLEVVLWSHRDFRRNEPPDPNASISDVSIGANVEDSQAPDLDRRARRIPFESLADLTGQNADGNSEIFVFDERKGTYAQVTDSTTGENRRPSTHTGRQFMFDSDADLTGQNADGNREIFFARFRRTGWTIEQITDTTAPVENLMGTLGKRGKIVAFSSNGDFTGQNADGNREIFVWDRGDYEQITNSTAGENVAPAVNTRGRFIAFESTNDADGTGSTVFNRRIFLYDRKKGTTRLVSRSFFGENSKPRISAGRFVVWQSTADLTGSNPGGETVIYLYDRRKDN